MAFVAWLDALISRNNFSGRFAEDTAELKSRALKGIVRLEEEKVPANDGSAGGKEVYDTAPAKAASVIALGKAEPPVTPSNDIDGNTGVGTGARGVDTGSGASGAITVGVMTAGTGPVGVATVMLIGADNA